MGSTASPAVQGDRDSMEGRGPGGRAGPGAAAAATAALPETDSGLGLRHPLEPEGQGVQVGAGGQQAWRPAGSCGGQGRGRQGGRSAGSEQSLLGAAQKEGAQRLGSRLTTERVPAAAAAAVAGCRQVGAGPQPQQALLAAVQAPLQTPLCLSERVLVRGLRPKLGFPGPKSERSLTFPAGTGRGKGRQTPGVSERSPRMRPSPGTLLLLRPCPPLAGVAFTVLILVTEEALPVEARHLVPWLDVPEHLHTGSIPI